MGIFKKIILAALVVIITACSKKYSVVGEWIEVNDNPEKGTSTRIDTYKEDGSYKSVLSLQSGDIGLGAKFILEGTYDIIGDSLIIYGKKATLMGQPVSIKGDGIQRMKILQLDDNNLIISVEGKKTTLKRKEESGNIK